MAGFSTMSASLFAVVNLLVTMAGRRCTEYFTKKLEKFRKRRSLVLAAIGLSASIVTALLLPGKYTNTLQRAGILQMYNWSFIIISAYKILKVRMWDVILGGFGIILLLGAVTGTIMEKSIRPGFVSLILVACGYRDANYGQDME